MACNLRIPLRNHVRRLFHKYLFILSLVVFILFGVIVVLSLTNVAVFLDRIRLYNNMIKGCQGKVSRLACVRSRGD